MNQISKDAYEGDLVCRLKNWRGLHLAHGGQLFDEAACEIERLRLTEKEREAIAYVELMLRCERHPMVEKHTDAMRGLLDRTK